MFLPGVLVDDVGAAQKLRRNGGDDAGAEREGNQRIESGLIVPGAQSHGDQHNRSGDDRRNRAG